MYSYFWVPLFCIHIIGFIIWDSYFCFLYVEENTIKIIIKCWLMKDLLDIFTMKIKLRIYIVLETKSRYFTNNVKKAQQVFGTLANSTCSFPSTVSWSGR